MNSSGAVSPAQQQNQVPPHFLTTDSLNLMPSNANTANAAQHQFTSALSATGGGGGGGGGDGGDDSGSALDRLREGQMLRILQNAAGSEHVGWFGGRLPPCVSLMVDSAEYLAASAFDSWETLCAELACQRTVFKFCCSPQGQFDHTIFQSYCTRLRLIQASIRCGLLVALRAVVDQLRVWLQVGAATARHEQSHMSDNNIYINRLFRLVGAMQHIETNICAVQFPDAATLATDTVLMAEVSAQYRSQTGSKSGHKSP